MQIGFKVKLVLLLALTIVRFHCSILMNRPINKRLHEELLARMFPTFESSVYNLRALYSCVGHTENQKQNKTASQPRCCSCDEPSCHLRKDCCFDVGFIANPTPWEAYIERLVANRQDNYNNGSCSAVSKSAKRRGWKTQYVYARNKCKDGTSCFGAGGGSPSFGRMVVGKFSGQFYINELCALCNEETNFRYPKMKLLVQTKNSESDKKVILNKKDGILNLAEFFANINNNNDNNNNKKNNKTVSNSSTTTTNSNIKEEKESTIAISLDSSEKTAINCPYGELARPDKAYSKCTRLEYELCLSYVAVVADSRRGYAANPHCVKCMPFHAKPKLDVLKCDSLSHAQWTSFSPSIELLMETNTSYAAATILKDGRTTSEVEPQTARLCSTSTGQQFDIATMSCQPTTFFQQFLVKPTVTSNNITNSNQANKTRLHGNAGTLLYTEDVSFDELMVTFDAFLGIWYPVLILVSMISLFLIMVTFATIKGLHHPPGVWVLLITALLFFYFILQLTCVFYHTPPPRIRTYVPLLNHWCVLTKHAFLCMLSYELFAVYGGRKQAVHSVVVRVVATFIVTAAAIIMCGWKEAFIQYGDCLILSLNGRMFVYWLPVVTLSFGSMFSLRVLRLNITQNTRAAMAIDAPQPVDQVDDLLLMKAVNATFRFNLIAVIIDTLAAVRFDVNGGNRELYQLFNAAARLLFCTLNGLQGVFVLIIFMKRKFILMTYRKKVTRAVRKLTDLFCCEFCFRYDEQYVYSEEQTLNETRDTLNETRETIALSSARSSFV